MDYLVRCGMQLAIQLLNLTMNSTIAWPNLLHWILLGQNTYWLLLLGQKWILQCWRVYYSKATFSWLGQKVCSNGQRQRLNCENEYARTWISGWKMFFCALLGNRLGKESIYFWTASITLSSFLTVYAYFISINYVFNQNKNTRSTVYVTCLCGCVRK